MRVSYVVAIILKLYSIYWLVTAAIGIIGVAGSILSKWIPGDPHAMALFSYLLAPGFYVLLAMVAWFAADQISQMVVRGDDREIGFHQIQPRDIYTFGLLIVGTIFFMENFSQVFNWFHHFASKHQGASLYNTTGKSTLYTMTSHLLPCVGGAVLAIMSPKLGQRLACSHKQPQREAITDISQ